MKTVSIVSGVIAAISLVSVASAVQINTSAQGTLMTVNGADQVDLSRSTTGVRNVSAFTRYTFASVPRNPHAAGNQTVTWAGYSNNIANNNCCTIYAVQSGGGVTGKTACTTGVSGYFVNSTATFTTLEAPSTAAYAAYCTLLPSSANYVRTFQVSP
ncbi:MAG: hypothetical protein QM784_38230 [Polyangiaceae bacterium]